MKVPVMKIFLSKIVFFAAGLTLSACGSDSSKPSEAECDAVPVCDSSSYEVEACDTTQPICDAVTLCGTTIYCEGESDPGCDPTTEVTECENGYELVDACAPDRDCIDVSAPWCSAKYCQEPLAQCDAVPVCASDYLEVDSCPTDTDCQDVTVCGQTISCRKDARCENPVQPMCPADYYLIQSCPTDTNCTTEMICGMSVSCMEGTIDCLMPPECAEGTTEVSVCGADKPCNELIECGIRLYCEDNAI